MNKLLLTAWLATFSVALFSQNNVLILKKKNQNMQYFTRGSYLSIQLKNRQWFKGVITKVTTDSIYLNKEEIRFTPLGPDTVHYSGYNYPIKDIFAVPKKGVQIDEMNGGFQITKSGGHIHWYWIKNGWIFIVGSAGYAVLNILNGLIKKDFNFSGSRLGISAGFFAAGVFLNRTYSLALPLGNKYHFETMNLSR